jgi:hypothetical protein
MSRSVISFSAVVVMSVLLAACGAPGQGPMTWLDRPLDGSHLPLGPVTILAHASDTDGVRSFEFSVDGDPLAIVPASGGRLGERTARWTPAEPGTYTVRVRATDSAGNVGSEATSVVTVGEVLTPSPTTPPEADEGEILFFVEPELIPTGGCAVLRWEVLPPADALLNGEGVPPTGEREVCPEETTGYELLVPEREQERTVTLRVERPGEAELGMFLAVDPDAISQGQCAMLIWEVGAPEEWRVLLDGSEVPHFGESEVCPPSTTSYELLVEAPDGPQVRTVTLHVEGGAEPTTPSQPTSTPATAPTATAPPGCGGAPVISYFRANPSTINVGGTSTLEWGRVTNGNSDVLVRSVVIQPGLGEVGSPGQRPVSPQTTTVYTLIATGCGGETRQDVTVVVSQAPPPAPSGIDLAITDLYAQSLYGPLWARITNHGPGTVSNATIQISCPWDRSISGRHLDSGQWGPIPIPIGNLGPGQTQAFNTDFTLVLPGHQYDITCTIQVPFNDPNMGNNTHSETLTEQNPGGT